MIVAVGKMEGGNRYVHCPELFIKIVKLEYKQTNKLCKDRYGFKPGGRNINNLHYSDGLITKTAWDLQNLILKVKECSEKNGTKIEHKEDQTNGNKNNNQP